MALVSETSKQQTETSTTEKLPARKRGRLVWYVEGVDLLDKTVSEADKSAAMDRWVHKRPTSAAKPKQ
jgi:hypothetical protein